MQYDNFTGQGTMKVWLQYANKKGKQKILTVTYENRTLRFSRRTFSALEAVRTNVENTGSGYLV